MRLSYLNQPTIRTLGLRRGRPCLTQQELDDIDSNQERENVSSIHRPSRLYHRRLMTQQQQQQQRFFSIR